MKMMQKKNIIIAVIFLIISSMILSVNAIAETNEVIPNDETGISDKVLYEAILEAADENNDGILTKKEAAKITKVNLTGTGIASLQGIGNLQKLTELYVSNNQLTSLTGSLRKIYQKSFCQIRNG